MDELARRCTRRQFFGAVVAGLADGLVAITGLGALFSGKAGRPVLSAKHAPDASRPQGARPRAGPR